MDAAAPIQLPTMEENYSRLGARLLRNGQCQFSVWAPAADTVEVLLQSPIERRHQLSKHDDGTWVGTVDGVEVGALYQFRLNGEKARPDPASRSQPYGVHKPSQVVADDFHWTDASWSGIKLEECVFYEIHVGTFTPKGTLDALISHLDSLKDLESLLLN